MARWVSTRAMFLLYSTEPRRSATGSVASAAACAAPAMTSSASGARAIASATLLNAPRRPPRSTSRAPVSASSAADARIGAMPRLVSPMPARVTLPSSPSVSCTATPATA